MNRISLLIGAVSMLIALCSANPLEKRDSLAGLGLNGIGGNSPTCDAWISDKMAETGLAVDDIAKSKRKIPAVIKLIKIIFFCFFANL